MGMWLLAVAAALAPGPALSPGEAAALGKRAVAVLTEYGQRGDSESRALAAAAWGQIGNPAAAALLRKALRDRNVIVRIEAATSLHKLGDDERAFKALEAVIVKGSTPTAADFTPEQEMRRLSRDKARARAVARLSEFGGEDAVTLFETTLKDPSQIVREATSKALARMGLDEFADPFLKALQDKDEAVRAAAVRALGEIGRPDYLPAVKDAAGDPSALVREAAMTALSGFPGSAPAPILALGLRDEDARVRAKALLGLSKIADTDTSDLLRAELRDTTAPEAALKAQAGLARRGAKVDLGLADRTLQAKDADLKALALEVITEDPSDDATLLLKRTMEREEEPRLKLGAASALVKRLQRRRS
jgi:HEAT repeat protein